MAKQQTTFDEATLSIGPEGALDAIRAAGDSAEALVEQWVNKANAGAVQSIADHGSGAARKAARRGLNVLRSRGITAQTGQRKAALFKAENKEPEALMLPPDSAGVRLIAISRTRSDGSCSACLVYVRDGQGILRVESSESTPTRLRSALGQALPGSGLEAVSVPVPWARAKIASARLKHRERGLIEPLGFSSNKELLEPVPANEVEHPFDAEGFEFGDEDARDLAQDSGSLHHLPEFRSWLPTQNAIQDLLTNVGKNITPGQKPDHDAATELIKNEMLEATDRYFTAERCSDLIEWMKDAAVSVLAREGESTALKVAATIQVIRSSSDSAKPARDVPFLRAFFEKALSVLMTQNGGRLDIPLPKAEQTELQAS
ncbi:MAG TPA: hypothetical protein VHM70_17535 [Polyangiaceae bacterium]|jgi:hypothetical protein|nr:hypothetical protein [Polyangiaceae bacterium]